MMVSILGALLAGCVGGTGTHMIFDRDSTGIHVAQGIFLMFTGASLVCIELFHFLHGA